jgi:hypothetical protein
MFGLLVIPASVVTVMIKMMMMMIIIIIIIIIMKMTTIPKNNPHVITRYNRKETLQIQNVLI